jgi:predicted ATP-grasp superfamily ATP-dependent carboligase
VTSFVAQRTRQWFGLTDTAGVDFGAAIVSLTGGDMPPPMRARRGVGWMFGQCDPVVALQLALAGRLDVGDWLASLARTRTFASLSLSDPLPGLMDLPLAVLRVLAR